MATYESAAFRDLSISPVGRAVVAGGHDEANVVRNDAFNFLISKCFPHDVYV